MKWGPTLPQAGRRGPSGPGGASAPGSGVEALGVRILVVHGYGTVERSVEPRRGLSCQIGVPTEIQRKPDFGRYGPTAPDDPRRKTRWTRIGVRLRYGPIRIPDEPRRALTAPNGIQPDVNK